jgi:Pro-kumamolisin, activation domain
MRAKIVVAAILLCSFALGQDAQQRRIVRPVNNASIVRLRGTLVPRARAELDRGPVAANMPMQHLTLVFQRTAAQQAALDRLLVELQDPNAPNYHQWLTPEQVRARFGLAQADMDVVSAWLLAQGFTVEDIARSGTWISFSGTAAQAEAAFQVPIHNYVVDGKMHHAPSTEAAIPDAFAGVVAAVIGLHDFRPRVHSRARHANPQITSSISGNHFIVPGDFGTIYNLPDYANGVFQPGIDGTGQTIGIVGQTTLTSSGAYTDNDTFRSLSRLPPANLTQLLAGGTVPAFSTTDVNEANLDIEWSGAVAPNAAIIFAYSSNALTTSLKFLVNQNQASVISISYGDCEANFNSTDISAIEGYLLQAFMQGQSVFAAAGDNGATDCDGTAKNPATIATHGLAVDYPASSVYVTAMGGTEFTGDSTATPVNGVAPAQTYWNSSSDPNDTSASAFSYIPESVWNDTATVSQNVATGGGVSKQFAKPSWQTGNGVPADGQRDVPDVALASSPNHDGIIICSQGSCQNGYRRTSDQTYTVIGGTSAAVPAFAGIAALVNQKLGARQGNLNPKLYSTAASSPWAFNDIITGDNKVPCQTNPPTPDCTSSPIGYSAAAGYDLVTGLGSVDATALLNAFNGTPSPHFILLPFSRNVSVVPAVSSTVAVSVTPKEGFTGSVALSCLVSSSLSGATCSFDNTNVATPGSANLTIQSGSVSAGQTGPVTIQGFNGSNSDSVVINVAIVAPDFQISSGNNIETVAAGSSVTDTITLTSVQSFSGQVIFSCSGTAGVTCSLSPNTLTANPSAAATTTLTVAVSSSTSSGSAIVTATSGTLTHALQIPVTVTAATADFTLTVASPVVSIPSAGTITDNVTVAPAGGFSSDVALTCSVPSSLGTTSCTISPSTVPGGNGTALVTIKGAVLSSDRRAPLPFPHRGLGAYASFVFALGVVFTVNPARLFDFKRIRSLRNVVLGLLLLCFTLGTVSCGGGGGGGSTGTTPTPLNGNVTVTATSGSLTHTTTINVTVQ